MTDVDRRPFSLLACCANQRGCIAELITKTKNHKSLLTPQPAISRRTSPGLRRTDRPIETAGIAPKAIWRRTVRADTLRIAATSTMVRSGSRQEARPTATRCLLRPGAASRMHRLPVRELNWSSRSRGVELPRQPRETSAVAHGGISGDRIFDPDFDALDPSTASMVEAPSGGVIPHGPGAAVRGRRTGNEREGRILRALPVGLDKADPKTRCKSAEVLGSAA